MTKKAELPGAGFKKCALFPLHNLETVANVQDVHVPARSLRIIGKDLVADIGKVCNGLLHQ